MIQHHHQGEFDISTVSEFDFLMESGVATVFFILITTSIMKRYFKFIPKEAYPILNIIEGIFLMLVHTPDFYIVEGWGVDIVTGTIYGLAATGAYQVYKRIQSLLKRRAFIKKGKRPSGQLKF